MTCEPDRVIGIAASTGQLVCVLMVNRKVQAKEMYYCKKLQPFLTGEQVKCWIRAYHPEVVITENVGFRSRKAMRTIRSIHAVIETAEKSGVQLLTVFRVRRFKSKYEEAAALASIYPEMRELLPERKRKAFEAEPHRMLYFEALSMLHVAYHGDIKVK